MGMAGREPGAQSVIMAFSFQGARRARNRGREMTTENETENDFYRNRRRFLTTVATVLGGAGVAAAALPFLSMMMPSARTRVIGRPVDVDIGGLQPGELRVVEWRGKPVWVLHRAPEMLDALGSLDEALSDPGSEYDNQPEYAHNPHRSRRPEYLVIVGRCTHLGCSPVYLRPEDPHSFEEPWKGGFLCPCHGSRFDLAGRVYKGVPAQPNNLVVPSYRFLSDTRIRIGEDAEVA